MALDSHPKTTRRKLLGASALGLTGLGTHSMIQEQTTNQSTDPDGHIITYPDCQTAIVEGDHWTEVQFSMIHGPTNDGMDFTQPDKDGVTQLSIPDSEGGYINWVKCFVERDDTRFLAVERENPNECNVTTTANKEIPPPEETVSVEVTYQDCYTVQFTKYEPLQWAELTFTDGTRQRSPGPFNDENTLRGTGEHDGKILDRVRFYDGENYHTALNQQDCQTTTTETTHADNVDNPDNYADTTTTTEQVADARLVTDTPTTTENETRRRLWAVSGTGLGK